jgi:hypothetical protein
VKKLFYIDETAVPDRLLVKLACIVDLKVVHCRFPFSWLNREYESAYTGEDFGDKRNADYVSQAAGERGCDENFVARRGVS